MLNELDMNYIELEKLKWRSRRSLLELDLFLNRFIQDGHFASLDVTELNHYQQLLQLDDGDLLLLLQGKQSLNHAGLQGLISKIGQLDMLATDDSGEQHKPNLISRKPPAVGGL